MEVRLSLSTTTGLLTIGKIVLSGNLKKKKAVGFEIGID